MDYYRVKGLRHVALRMPHQDRFSDSIKGDLLVGDRW